MNEQTSERVFILSPLLRGLHSLNENWAQPRTITVESRGDESNPTDASTWLFGIVNTGNG
jgi:hypothetical protein